ncbi:hypothetical protein GCM10012275_38600 [Longimycelium tulufanense]|uniref:Uncharacterized protein n=1 Tax=Longimycelium tulufanense TaxID=907463 RepID=A0A8J3CAA5_9PSEU|nr:hypothetical protein [Longimycelium tulufanense]GGM64317.1 hypothetical protein GCM10012275_38600 [Longimycelium tulufanense]
MSELTFAQQQAAGLRALADLIEDNPALAERLRYSLERIISPLFSGENDHKALLAAFARAGKRHGAQITKDSDGKYFGVNLTWGPVTLYVYAERERVCERVVVGTETVTEEVPDPEVVAAAPTVTRTRTVEQVEWRCTPLLAENGERA